MIDAALAFATLCFGAALMLTLWRLIVAPTAVDRVLALDTAMVNMVALLVLGSIGSGSDFNFHAALLLAMTGFVSSVAFCKFLLRGTIVG